MRERTTTLFLTALLTLTCTQAQNNTSTSLTISIPASPGPTPGIPLEAFLSYSIEFSAFVDFAGNDTSPNTFSQNLLANIGELQGAQPYLRVGGNSQDQYIFVVNQTQQQVNIPITSGSPRLIYIGPSWYKSLANLPGSKFIYGFNLAANDTYNPQSRASLLASARYACQALQNGSFAYWELGNEPDLYRNSSGVARRPATWSNEDYVSEWLNGTRAIKPVIQQYCPSLGGSASYKFYAPSFAAASGQRLDLVGVLRDGLDADGTVGVISMHNYISGATSPGVTLQKTLMNHTSTVNSLDKHLIVKRNISLLNSSLYPPDTPYILGETNSLYNGGASGLSDVFGAALWSVDFSLYAAANNISRVHFHQGGSAPYASWRGSALNVSHRVVKPPYYGNLATAAFIGNGSTPSIVNIPLSSQLESAYAAYMNGSLARMMIISMQEYNGTEGNAFRSNASRPSYNYTLALPSSCSGSAVLQRLMANGSDAQYGITFDGLSYNVGNSGLSTRLENTTSHELANIIEGNLIIQVPASSAVLVHVQCGV